MPRIALNGLGRIGKLVLRDLIDTGAGGDIVLLNAAAAFLVGEKVETLREGVELAAQVIADGRARAALERLVQITSQSEATA